MKGEASAHRWPRPWSSDANSFTRRVSANSSALSIRRTTPSSSKAKRLSFSRPPTRPRSQQMSLQALANLREAQAASLSYFDDFWIFAVIPAALVFLVLFMKRSVAEKGAHIGAE